jgi:hypothetical protein
MAAWISGFPTISFGNINHNIYYPQPKKKIKNTVNSDFCILMFLCKQLQFAPSMSIGKWKSNLLGLRSKRTEIGHPLPFPPTNVSQLTATSPSDIYLTVSFKIEADMKKVVEGKRCHFVSSLYMIYVHHSVVFDLYNIIDMIFKKITLTHTCEYFQYDINISPRVPTWIIVQTNNMPPLRYLKITPIIYFKIFDCIKF